MKIKQSLNYGFEPEKYMFGMCEEFEGSLDEGADSEVTISLIAELGAKCMRIWMHNKRLLQLDKNGRAQLKPDAVERYKRYVRLLREKGVTRLVGMNHSYLYPLEYKGNHNSTREVPEFGSSEYLGFLRLIEESYALIATEFPEIEYFECGNEVNMNDYIAKAGYTEMGIGNNGFSEQYCYTNLEKAQITADICYYATLGVKRGNKNAHVVFPSPTPYRDYAEMAEFYSHVYGAIESGRFPSGLSPDTNADNYFAVQCWHAYNFGGNSQRILQGAKMIYDVMKRHGDEGKKVFITEFGYTEYDFEKNKGMTQAEADEVQASFFLSDVEAFKQCGFIESVFFFRLYNWNSGPGMEVSFGLFTSPSDACGIVPKQKGLKLFKIFNGNKDTSRLYRYAK